MELFLSFYLFLTGIVFGSFYNVVGLRVPVGESINKPRSHCPNCKHNLEAIDLVPVLSYLLLLGKCRRCKTTISPIYPVIELSVGLLFVFSYQNIGWNWELAVAILLISLCAIIVVTDVTYMLIPDKVLLCFVPMFLLLRGFISPLEPWWAMLVGAVIGFGLLFLVAVVSRGGMGGGDIKLFGVLGVVFGFPDIFLVFILSTLFGTIFGFIGLLLKKVKRKKPIPFGPYIAAGSLVTYFYGKEIISWYMQWFSY